MKKQLVTFCAVIMCMPASVAQVVEEYYPFVNTMYEVNDMARDNAGNFVLPNDNYSPVSTPIITKYNPAGNVLWEALSTSDELPSKRYVCADAAGNIYVWGNFTANFQLAGWPQFQSSGSSDFYLAKFSDAGVLQWAQPFGGIGAEVAKGIGCDAAGNVYVLGSSYTDVLDFGNGVTLTQSATVASDFMSFVLKVLPSGGALWATNIEGSTFLSPSAFHVVSNGEVYVTGNFTDRLVVNQTMYFTGTPNANRAYCVKIGANGTADWVKAGSAGSSYQNASAVYGNAAGSFFVGGYYSGTNVSFDGIALPDPASDAENGFIIKYDASGNAVWTKTVTHIDSINTDPWNIFPTKAFRPTNIAEDAAGGCVVSGQFGSGFSIGNTVVASTQDATADAFLCRLDNQGDYAWFHHIGRLGSQSFSNKLLVDQLDNVYYLGLFGALTTNYTAPATFGNLLQDMQTGNFLFRVATGNLVSAPEPLANTMQVYPNPSKGQFTVQCSNIWASQVQAELRNVLGQVVWHQTLPIENGVLKQEVRTSGLSKGVYYLQLRTDQGSKVQKLVLE